MKEKKLIQLCSVISHVSYLGTFFEHSFEARKWMSLLSQIVIIISNFYETENLIMYSSLEKFRYINKIFAFVDIFLGRKSCS